LDPIVEVRPVEPLGVEVMTLSVTDAVEEMGRPFRRAFGRSRTGRRLGASAWAAFHAALLHDCGIAVATSHAQAAAHERNRRTLIGPRWARGRITRVVLAAAEAAANSS
jgi:hypothetical protein